MTDANFRSSLYLKNSLVTSALEVTPVLYLANGMRVQLAPVKLEPAGVATVSINQALADNGIAPYAELYGYVEVEYMWPWDAICATVENKDLAHSLVFGYGLQLATPSALAQPTTEAKAQTLEGLWWKQEANVNGFVALTNPGTDAISASLAVMDAQGNPISQTSVTVSPHGTKMLGLEGLPATAGSAGGLRVQYKGQPNALLASGGLRDDASGYSADIFFAAPPASTGQASTTSYAELGLMTGSADPMMHFPASTVFTPYAVARNISSQAVVITPNLWWMEGGAAQTAVLPQFTLGPTQTKNLNLPGLLAQAGLKGYNGSVNLVLNIAANAPGAVLLDSGSVDQKSTYVFQVVPKTVKESIAKELSYWSTANGDDTMVTVWNPADEAQDFVFTLFYIGGHYLYPIHLEPRVTHAFNISEILRSGLPDSEGNLIPVGIRDGSAQIAGSQGEAQHILVVIDEGVYNVQKATCDGNRCLTCQGAINSWITGDPFAVPVGGTNQLAFIVQNHNGDQYNDTTSAAWSGSNASIATVGATSGLVTGVKAGSVNVGASDDNWPVYTTGCTYAYSQDCPIYAGVAASGTGTVQVPTSLSLVLANKVTYNGNNMIECNGTNDGPRWGYSRCATFTLLDQNGKPITIGSYKASETVSTISSNPPGLQAKTGGGQLVNGQYTDFWAFVAVSSPAPPPGEYIKSRQRIKITSQNGDGTIYNDIRINCLDFESSDVSSTDITNAGVCQ